MEQLQNIIFQVDVFVCARIHVGILKKIWPMFLFFCRGKNDQLVFQRVDIAPVYELGHHQPHFISEHLLQHAFNTVVEPNGGAFEQVVQNC